MRPSTGGSQPCGAVTEVPVGFEHDIEELDGSTPRGRRHNVVLSEEFFDDVRSFGFYPEI